MELRLLVAYGLMTAMGSGGLAWAVVARRRWQARRLRMRGVKSQDGRGRVA